MTSVARQAAEREIRTREAWQQIRWAVWAGTVTTVISAVLAARSGDPLAFIDVGVTGLLTVGVRCGSRAAAVVLTVYWGLAKLAELLASKQWGLGVAALFLGFFFVQGIIGTLALHRLRREAIQGRT